MWEQQETPGLREMNGMGEGERQADRVCRGARGGGEGGGEKKGNERKDREIKYLIIEPKDEEKSIYEDGVSSGVRAWAQEYVSLGNILRPHFCLKKKK